MKKKMLCCCGFYQNYQVKPAPCKVWLDLPFGFEIQLKPRYFESVSDCGNYSFTHFKGRPMMDDNALKSMMDSGQPYWINIDVDDPADCFESIRFKRINGAGSKVGLPDDCTGYIYDVKKDNVYVYKRKNQADGRPILINGVITFRREYDETRVYAGDAFELLELLNKERLQRLKWNEEYRERQREYVDLVIEIAKGICERDNGEDCAFLLNDRARQKWAIQRVEQAQIEAMERLGYEA